MCLRLLVQVLGEQRRFIDNRLHRRILAVEDAQRIGFKPAFAVFIQFVESPLQVVDQCTAVAGARPWRTQGINLQYRMFKPETLPHARRHEDHFGVNIRAGHAK